MRALLGAAAIWRSSAASRRPPASPSAARWSMATLTHIRGRTPIEPVRRRRACRRRGRWRPSRPAARRRPARRSRPGRRRDWRACTCRRRARGRRACRPRAASTRRAALARDLRERERAGVAEHRRDDAAGRRDREREMHGAAALDRAVGAGVRVQLRHLGERAGERDDEQVGDGDAALGRRRCRARRTSPSAASSPPMWTCGICCQLAAMLATTACAEPVADARCPAAGPGGGGEVRARRCARRAPCPARRVSSTPRSRASRRAAGEATGRPRDAGVAAEQAGRAPPAAARPAPEAAARRRRRAGGLELGEHAVDGARPRPPRRRSGAGLPPAPRSRPVALSVSTSTSELPGDDGVAVVDEPAAHLRLLHRDGELRHRHRGHATRRSTAATTSSALG